MKVLNIYDSYFGNTQKIAEIIGNSFKAHNIITKKVDFVTNDDFTEIDLLILGSPTRGFTMSKPILEKIKEWDVKGKRFFVYDTRIDTVTLKNRFFRWIVTKGGYASPKMEKKLLKKGGIQAQEFSYYFVSDTKGPLEQDVLQKVLDDIKDLL